MIALLISLVIWALIFYILWWGLNTVGIQEPFRKVFIVILVPATIIVLIGLLTGSIAPFPITTSL